ncbi:conserved hypothetical protein [Bathymodiolus platifrons methanotrophic gill symbiont]|uniref:DUF4326 domain-containing protein n=1 Tax=Bathymodiolus platifrons methanotrophic gill symbiont TaxID=113268 RepID=UPI000B41465C|nr:DUF4326 domain-containing protein [Bathymodiolus platifrons methanotrophic gill symbiont]GAW86717.1 conserved hypothetical protein [Bathymodiolus platifrons methanotrophic gill symbiont]GFO77360.1 hypothetical protein BPLS_P5756 [Bathymodiolus platifrons methanotrophic gill symbiont]
MNSQDTPTILIAYPKTFLCYGKFERKLSNILSNLNQFYIAYLADDHNFIKKHLSSDQRVNDAITSSIGEEHLDRISHAIIFNDGKTFNHLIENVKLQGVKTRIIDAGITRVVNKDKGEDFDVYIGRGSDWGNPHAVGFGASPGEEQNDREEAIRKFKYDFEKGYLKKNKEDALKLKGKILGCHCKPLACHGDVISDYLNSLDDGK